MISLTLQTHSPLQCIINVNQPQLISRLIDSVQTLVEESKTSILVGNE